MTDRPLVSIVTPTLNQGRFIEQTIRSIEAQTYRNFEHIVVDGGSTDETLEVLRNHEGVYPMRWTSEPDRGMYHAINKGMAQATGQILAYLNSDDLYFPWTLEVVVDAFERHPDADLLCGDCVRTDECGRSYLLFQPAPYTDYVQRSGFLAQPTVFWRSALKDQLGGFDERLRFAADCDYWMRALPSGKIVRVDEFLAIDTIQADAQRSTHGSAVVSEINAVRRGYVRFGGPGHLIRLARNRAWGASWRRILWLRFLMSKARLRHGAVRPWGRWLELSGSRISVRRAVLAQLPVVGDRFAWRALRSDPADD